MRIIGNSASMQRIYLYTDKGLSFQTSGNRLQLCPGPFDISVSTAGMKVIGFAGAFNYISGPMGRFVLSNIAIQT